MIVKFCEMRYICDCEKCQTSMKPLKAEFRASNEFLCRQKAEREWLEIVDHENGKIVGHIHKSHFKIAKF